MKLLIITNDIGTLKADDSLSARCHCEEVKPTKQSRIHGAGSGLLRSARNDAAKACVGNCDSGTRDEVAVATPGDFPQMQGKKQGNEKIRARHGGATPRPAIIESSHENIPRTKAGPCVASSSAAQTAATRRMTMAQSQQVMDCNSWRGSNVVIPATTGFRPSFPASSIAVA
jgi:hypothetical protein